MRGPSGSCGMHENWTGRREIKHSDNACDMAFFEVDGEFGVVCYCLQPRSEECLREKLDCTDQVVLRMRWNEDVICIGDDNCKVAHLDVRLQSNRRGSGGRCVKNDQKGTRPWF